MTVYLKDPVRVRGIDVWPVVRETAGDNYPLPGDYDSLTKDGQRIARINGCRQWLLHPRYVQGKYHQNPVDTDDPERLMWSLRLFDRLYLQRGYYEGFSNFYDVDPESEAPHLDKASIYHHVNHKCIIVMPRGFAKTSFNRKLVMLGLLSSPVFRMHYYSSTMKVARPLMEPVFTEFENNSQIHDDWSGQPEFGGRIKGSRGSNDTRPWSFQTGVATLTNGSQLKIGGVEEASRGGRPHWLGLDDVEKDGTSSTDMQNRREKVHNLIFSLYKPMIRDPRRQMLILGTLISPQHLLAHATLEDPETGNLGMESFRQFARVIFQAGYPSMEDLQYSLWEDYWPVAQMRKDIELAEPDEREKMQAEYFAKPGSATSNSLQLDGKLHGYEIREPVNRNPVGSWGPDPYESDLVVNYWSAINSTNVSLSSEDFFSSLRIFITSDWNLSTSATADYSCIAVMGVNSNNELFVLDMMLQRMQPSDLVDEIVRMIFKWKPRAVGVEAPSLDHTVHASLEVQLRSELDRLERRPKLVQIPTHGESKEEKIAALQWRIGTAKRPAALLKLPFQWRKVGVWGEVFYQLEHHNPGVKGGGIRNDDAIETISMESKMMMHTRKTSDPHTLDQYTLIQKLLTQKHPEGELLRGLDPTTEIPAILVDRIGDSAREREEATNARAWPPRRGSGGGSRR